MHAGVVGSSVRPWLITTTAAARCSSAGSFWRWATIALRHDNGRKHRGAILNGRRVEKKRLRCESERPGLFSVDSLEGERRQTDWAFERRRPRIGLGLWNSAKEERELSSVARARRGFLSELQSLRDEKDAEASGAVEFDSPLQIVLYPDPRLRNKNKRVTVFDEKLEQLVKEMFEVMYKTDGVGLAAPQVGVNVQLMLYNPEGERGIGAEYILVNPKIVKYGKQRDVFREGCLSFLKLEADVERPLSVRVEAQDIKGKKFAISLKGWQARIFQHEYDHLEGVLYHDRMSTTEVDTIRAGLKQLEEEYERRTGHPAPEKVE